jgi:hypothetical protein
VPAGSAGSAGGTVVVPSGSGFPSIVVGGPTIRPTTRLSRPARAGSSSWTAAGAAATVAIATFSPVHSRNPPHEPQKVSVSRLD